MSQTSAQSKSLIRFFARHRLAATLLIVISFLCGGYSIFKLNVRFLPPLDLNLVSVTVPWPGASPSDVEQSITNPVEKNIKNLSDVKKLVSFSSQGLSYIAVEFNSGTNMLTALNNVRSEVGTVRDMPRNALKPIVEKSKLDERIARVVISSNDNLKALRYYAKKFKGQLLDQPSISRVGDQGMPKQIVSIGIPPADLAVLGQPLAQLGEQIQSRSQDISAGTVGLNTSGHQLRAEGKKRSVAGFENVPIITGDPGLLTHLRDIAKIKMNLGDTPKLAYYKGKPAISLTVYRSMKENSLTSAKELHAWRQSIQPNLPKGMTVKVYEEYWQLIKGRINVLLKNGLTGLILIFGLLYIFLNARVALWVALSIPISLSAALFALYLMGGSINMISMFALIMSLGIIVDDTIVVAEQSVTEVESGKTALEAVILGARKMFIPIIASSLTTVAAFLPLLLLSGMFGEVLVAIPRLVICVILASLVECLLILPMHLKHSLSKLNQRPPFKVIQSIRRGFEKFRNVHFRRLVTSAVTHSGITLSLALASFIMMGGVMAAGMVNFNFFPSPPGRVVDLDMTFFSGTSTKVMLADLRHIEKTAWKLNQDLMPRYGKVIKTAVVFTHKPIERGRAINNKRAASIVFDLTPPEYRDFSNQMFIDQLRRKIKTSPAVESISLSAPRSGPPGSDIDIGFLGANPRVLKQVAEEFQRRLSAYKGVDNIKDNLPYAQSDYVFKLRPEAKQLGFTLKNVGQQLRSAYTGFLVQTFMLNQEEYEVRVSLDDQHRQTLGSLEHTPIVTPQGKTVPLTSVVNLNYQRSFHSLQHLDGKLTVNVLAEVNPKLNNTNNIIAQLKKTVLPEITQKYGVSYVMKGRDAEQKNTLNEMKYAVIFAFSLIFIILAWVSSSYSWAFFVMLAIPFGLEGAVLGHIILGRDLTLLSLFGLFGLTGIVINDSIILLFRYKELLASGLSGREAIIDACCQRFRAVMLTSLTTIAGLLPLLFEKSLQAQFLIPMATSICFGLMFSTVIILLVIPAAITVFSKKRHSELPATEEWG
jgi:multidrug efflux pump subunit AcrB